MRARARRTQQKRAKYTSKKTAAGKAKGKRKRIKKRQNGRPREHRMEAQARVRENMVGTAKIGGERQQGKEGQCKRWPIDQNKKSKRMLLGTPKLNAEDNVAK